MEYKEVANSEEKRNVANFIVTFTEKLFYRHGKFVAHNPVLVILTMSIICALASVGFMNIHMEAKPEKLWIPQNSDFVKTLEWQRTNYPDSHRFALIIFEAENVLNPEYVKEMLRITNEVRRVSFDDLSGRRMGIEKFCRRVPALGRETTESLSFLKSLFLGADEDVDEEDEVDWSHRLDRGTYCQLFSLMPKACFSIGIHEIWSRDSKDTDLLTQQEVVDDVNLVTKSASYSFPMNFTKFLGGVEKNATGHVVGARSSLFVWINEINMQDIKNSTRKKKLSAGFASDVDEGLYNWEGAFIKMILKEKLKLPKGLSMWPQTIRSFTEVSEETIFDDVKLLAIGVAILTLYVFLMLGKLNCVEMRPILCLCGILSIGLSVVLSFGFCSGIGVVYGPIHSILPLLLLGLGVDDMFVIVQSLDNLERDSPRWSTFSVEEKMSKSFESAGAAITVTSLTDFTAFLIGSLTSLPALHSFCIYAAVGVLSLYLMQITFFFAAFTLDQKRLEDQRNSFLCCVKHKKWTPNEFSTKDICKNIFHLCFSKWLLRTGSKVFVLLITVAMTSAAVWGTINLRQEFNMIWFIPESSYVHQFMMKLRQFYPESGNIGNVFIEDIDLPSELSKVKWLTEKMNESQWISSVESWYPPLRLYILTDLNTDINNATLTPDTFSEMLRKFLFSTTGSKFQPYFFFDKQLECDENIPHIKASKIRYRHRSIKNRNDQIKAMEETKLLIRNANFSGHAACTSLSYSEWETNKLIVMETIQNLSLALVSVFVMTSILIVNIRASLLVMVCVFFTLIDVMALMTWWDLTIDTVTCINLVLCVGLSVDYSAHVALHFMKVRGSKHERVIKTMSDVGPPVFNGAFSTFLAFVLLAHSHSHVFESFFKIFLGVFVFGVFHGLIFLPVALSIVGPDPYNTNKRQQNQQDENCSKSQFELSTAEQTAQLSLS